MKKFRCTTILCSAIALVLLFWEGALEPNEDVLEPFCVAVMHLSPIGIALEPSQTVLNLKQKN
jgi:hypothetical protein